MSISIHAPARGATLLRIQLIVHYHLFQSTLPRGERPNDDNIWKPFSIFQSTLPRGERLSKIEIPSFAI